MKNTQYFPLALFLLLIGENMLADPNTSYIVHPGGGMTTIQQQGNAYYITPDPWTARPAVVDPPIHVSSPVDPLVILPDTPNTRIPRKHQASVTETVLENKEIIKATDNLLEKKEEMSKKWIEYYTELNTGPALQQVLEGNNHKQILEKLKKDYEQAKQECDKLDEELTEKIRVLLESKHYSSKRGNTHSRLNN